MCRISFPQYLLTQSLHSFEDKMQLSGRVFIAVSSILLLSLRVYAATHTWKGANNGLWSVGTNWVEGTAPTVGEANLVLDFSQNIPAISGQVAQNDITGLSIQTIYLPANNGGNTYTLT